MDHKCLIDWSWKKTTLFPGIGWYCPQDEWNEQYGKKMCAEVCLSTPRLEALIWAMTCLLDQRRSHVSFVMDSSELVNMTTTPMEWPSFSTHLEEFMRIKVLFPSFSLSLVSRNLNTIADNLTQSARNYPYDISYVNSSFFIWISEPF